MEYIKMLEKVYEVAYLRIVLHLDYELEEYKDLPFVNDRGVASILIDINTGQIVENNSFSEDVRFFVKAVDEGTYILYDKEVNEIDRLTDDYVPNDLIPERDGYGDYITLKINKDGLITNWYKNPSLSKFEG